MPDYLNIPQMLRNLADDIQSKEIDAKEIAIAVDIGGDVQVFGGGSHITMATTHFLFHRGAKFLMEFADAQDDKESGHA